MKNIYLSNTLCKDTYPGNKGGEFSNYLNQTLKLNGSWSVALNELYYIPNTWHNIRKNGNKIFIKIFGLTTSERTDASQEQRCTKTVYKENLL